MDQMRWHWLRSVSVDRTPFLPEEWLRGWGGGVVHCERECVKKGRDRRASSLSLMACGVGGALLCAARQGVPNRAFFFTCDNLATARRCNLFLIVTSSPLSSVTTPHIKTRPTAPFYLPAQRTRTLHHAFGPNFHWSPLLLLRDTAPIHPCDTSLRVHRYKPRHASCHRSPLPLLRHGHFTPLTPQASSPPHPSNEASLLDEAAKLLQQALTEKKAH